MKFKRTLQLMLPLLLCVTAHSQNTQRSNPREVIRQTNIKELDTLLLRKPILTAEDRAARLAALKQINDDFKALQVLNNKLMSGLKNGTTNLDYKSISNTLSQLGGKASRLQEGLLLPKPDKHEEPKVFNKIETIQQFSDALIEFDKVVASFATNPIFQNNNVVDIELGRKASGDLQLIIKQSGRLKKVATKLGK